LQGVAKPYRARGLKREGVEKEIKSTGKYPPLSGGEDARYKKNAPVPRGVSTLWLIIQIISR